MPTAASRIGSAVWRTSGPAPSTCATGRSTRRSSSTASRWYDGEASCILLGNVGKLFGGAEAFEDAHPDDGVLELGVLSAEGVREWAGTIARAVVGTASKSPHAVTTKVRSVRIKLDRKIPYEIDGGDRKKVRKLHIEIEPDAVRICVPAVSAA